MLNTIIISTAKQKTLAFFCLRPHLEFHEREVARQVGLSPGAAHEALQCLKKEGALSSERKGKMVFYQLEESRPLIRQYKTMAVVSALEPLVLELSTVADRVVLFGSTATGEYLADSDVDLFVISSYPEQTRETLFRFGKDFSREIRPVIMSLAEWMDYEKNDPAFYREVTRGLILYQKESYESEIQTMS
jgi:predicted nucleotidyltransferase